MSSKTFRASSACPPLRVLASLALAAASTGALQPAYAQNVRVAAGTIEDRRTTGKFFAGLEIELKLTGDDLEGARAARAVVTKAVDDKGGDLLPEEKKEAEFAKAGGGSGPNLKLALKNPARGASALTEVSGSVELYMPGRDPAAVAMIEKLLSRMDKPLASPALKSAQVELKLISPKAYRERSKKSEAEFEKEMAKHKEEMKKEAESKGMSEKETDALMQLAKGLMGMMGTVGENDLVFEIKDKDKRLFDLEVVGRDGTVISSNGSMTSSDIKIVNYKEKIPADAKLRVFLKTKKAVVFSPFVMKDVPLP
ncbi:MAG: hypothetical protein ABIT01_03895 [Thermoanaerobaculia bacterium]